MGYEEYFTDTVTVYHRRVDPATRDDVFTRAVVLGVMYRRKAERAVDAGGVVRIGESVSVTFLPESDPGALLCVGDLIVKGDGRELGADYTLRDLRRDHPEIAEVRSLADNRDKPYLKHRKAVCT